MAKNGEVVISGDDGREISELALDIAHALEARTEDDALRGLPAESVQVILDLAESVGGYDFSDYGEDEDDDEDDEEFDDEELDDRWEGDDDGDEPE